MQLDTWHTVMWPIMFAWVTFNSATVPQPGYMYLQISVGNQSSLEHIPRAHHSHCNVY